MSTAKLPPVIAQRRVSVHPPVDGRCCGLCRHGRMVALATALDGSNDSSLIFCPEPGAMGHPRTWSQVACSGFHGDANWEATYAG